MTSKELKAALRRNASDAKKKRPASVDSRARYFIAALSGSIRALGDKALSDEIFAVLDDQVQPWPSPNSCA